MDGTGQSWEYLDSWAWKDTAASNIGNWAYGGVNCSDGSTSNQTSNCPYPLCPGSLPSTCDPPTSLEANNISQTSADLSWVAGGTETVWELTYGPAGFTPGTGTLVPMLYAELHVLTGLTANTTYHYYVKADCGGGTLSSWSGPESFTTLPNSGSSQCDHTFTMLDTWGDGWNGATVDVNVNGATVLSGVSCSGASSDELFTASTGDAISLANWVSGSYDGEISVSYTHLTLPTTPYV